MTADLAGTVALVTGAGGGIGAAIAAALRARGAQLALVDVDRATLDATVAGLGAPGDEVAGVLADLTDDDEVAALPEVVAQRLGPVDVLVNNAGVRQIASILALTPA